MPKAVNKKKAFIDKKNAVSFQLVHRSQRDPLAADEEAPQMVLHQVNHVVTDPAEREKIKQEEREHGVFFEDNYNYLQHLKDRSVVEHDWSEADRFILNKKETEVKVGGNISLPTEVFRSKEEEEVGLLNKAAPRGLDLSLDPDIVAAMDEDYDYEDPDNELDDDFMLQAMGEGGVDVDEEDGDDDEEEEGSEGDWETDSDCMGGRSDDEFDDEVPELVPFDEEETKTKFTNYSMSSSCIRRNKGLSLLDDQFEKFMDQYGEFDEGALDGEEVGGTLDEQGERMAQLVKESEEERRTRRQNLLKEKDASRRLITLQEETECDEFVPIQVEAGRLEEKWDAESILSTYSNLYNHPKLISERKDRIELSSKTGIPKNTLGKGLTAAALKQLDRENEQLDSDDDIRSVVSRVSQLSVRNKHETAEEKKTRKAALKEYRRERRLEKKLNTTAFKAEKQRQEKILINNARNVQGNKIL